MSSPQPAITIETQILEYRKYQHEKKDKEDFTRNTAVVSFLLTSKYSREERPSEFTTYRVEPQKKRKNKYTYEHFRALEMNLTQREPGSWFKN